jgi:DNA polymerase V
MFYYAISQVKVGIFRMECCFVEAEDLMRASRPVPEPIESATFQLPLYANKRATGFAKPTTDYEEAGIDFNRLLYQHPAATYIMKVAQDGLNGSELLANDLVIIDAALTPQSGDLVVAQIENAFLLCRYDRQQETILLTPENVAYKALVVSAEMGPDFVFGVVSYILHRPKRRRR